LKSRLLRAASCTIVAIISLSFNSSTADTETLEIALPDLIGLYSTDGVTSRADTFQLNKSPTTVNNVWIRLTGVHQLSMYCCEDGASCGPWHVIIDAVIPDILTPADWLARGYAPWDYSSPLPYPLPYDFEDHIISFVTYNGATWDFLTELQGTIRLNCEPYYTSNPHCLFPYPDPYLEITEAVLVIEGEFSVAVKELSWGTIKALYSQ